MSRKPDFASGLKALWFGLVSLLLGPFALWFVLYGKKRRRNLMPRYVSKNLLLLAGFFSFNILLFFLPLPWFVVLLLYLASAGGTAWGMSHGQRMAFFHFKESEGATVTSRADRVQSFLASAFAIYPLVYILALLHNIGELDNFSIRLPSDVYTDGLLWMIYATPAVGLAAWIAWKAELKIGLRTLVYFYGSVVVILLWIMVWERLDVFLITQFYGADREPLLFSYRVEEKFRLVVKTIFYGGSFLLGIGYLVGAARTGVFIKRAMFLGLPSLLMYANMLFVLGDWNYYLSAFREHNLDAHHYGVYRFAARAQLARTPAAFRSPQVLDDWLELEYQSGKTVSARKMLRELSDLCGGKPYYARMKKRADQAMAALDSTAAKGVAPKLLDLPIIKPASYLDEEWYSLLSAVAFLKPSWTDLELKKRLLDLSNTMQLHLPKLENVPDLIPALRQLEIPVSTCFLTAERIKTVLAAGHVPFLSLYGHWVPISGYDPGRDGFYYYSYHPAGGGWDWLRNEDTDLFYHHAGDAFGTDEEKKRTRAYKCSLQRFVPAQELEDHIVDIGGVGLVLGDSSFASAAERKSAFLLEQGDVYYQDHENYDQAAANYQKAAALFPGDQVYSRMLYLKRRYYEFASDSQNYQNLFRDYPPDWMDHMGPDAKTEKAVNAKIMAGKLGTYLLMNWYSTPEPDTSAEGKAAMDTALMIFTRLHKMDPEEPMYVDSLATLSARKGDLVAGDKYYSELIGLYPFGNESAYYRLAWTRFRLGRFDEAAELLPKCSLYSEEAKYLTMKAATALHKGRFRSAYSYLARSLKIDKSIGETHALLAEFYRLRGDENSAKLHMLWQRRSS